MAELPIEVVVRLRIEINGAKTSKLRAKLLVRIARLLGVPLDIEAEVDGLRPSEPWRE